MKLSAREAGDLTIGVLAVLRIVSDPSLYALTGVRAAIKERRHAALAAIYWGPEPVSSAVASDQPPPPTPSLLRLVRREHLI